MEPIQQILSGITTAVQVVNGTVTVGQWLIGYIRSYCRGRKTGEVLQWLRDLGAVGEGDIRRLIEEAPAVVSLSPAAKSELTLLLSNLVRTSRFHTTQGTPLSSYLRCERLIEQLLANLEPKRRAGEAVGPGREGWKLTRFLGMGSFGEVWESRNSRHPDPRAFKFFTSPEGVEWIQREAEALYKVKEKIGEHPNVVRYLDITLEASPYPFLTLEYIAGGSLEDWILTPFEERRRLNLNDLMCGIARGLAEAHRYKIFHRDLKPANVLLTADGEPVPKVADFGLSRVEKEEGPGSSIISQGVTVGTRMYLPPEAIDPYEDRQPAQDDVFAFGVVWYQVLMGKIERPSYDFADRLKELTDSRTVRLLSRCLAHPKHRFRNAVELLEALEFETPPTDWIIPHDAYDVGPLAREYLTRE